MKIKLTRLRTKLRDYCLFNNQVTLTSLRWMATTLPKFMVIGASKAALYPISLNVTLNLSAETNRLKR